MTCPECKAKFNFVDRIKSMNRKNGKIQCRNCKNTFVIKKNSGRAVDALVTGVLVFTISGISSSIGKQYFENNMLVALLIVMPITAFILLIYYFISQNFCNYERYKEELKK